jgi:hypothetical protein
MLISRFCFAATHFRRSRVPNNPTDKPRRWLRRDYSACFAGTMRAVAVTMSADMPAASLICFFSLSYLRYATYDHA